jgi:hypothetical protein
MLSARNHPLAAARRALGGRDGQRIPVPRDPVRPRALSPPPLPKPPPLLVGRHQPWASSLREPELPPRSELRRPSRGGSDRQFELRRFRNAPSA